MKEEETETKIHPLLFLYLSKNLEKGAFFLFPLFSPLRKKKIKGKKEEGNLGVIGGLFFGEMYLENGMGERREGRGLSNLKI